MVISLFYFNVFSLTVSSQQDCLAYISSFNSWCFCCVMEVGCLTTKSKFYIVGHRLPSGPGHSRERIGRYFWLKWHFSSIYLTVPLAKPWATNKEDGIIACDWPASFQLEMKCPVVTYGGQTSFVQPEKWGHFSSLSVSDDSSLSWMMPLNAQLP